MVPEHAVAELGGVLDVVHAVTLVLPPSKNAEFVARITMPRRRIGRGRLTEGEAGELDEYELNRDIAAAGRIEQLRVVAEVARQAIRVERVPPRVLIGSRLPKVLGQRIFGRVRVSDGHAIRERAAK